MKNRYHYQLYTLNLQSRNTFCSFGIIQECVEINYLVEFHDFTLHMKSVDQKNLDNYLQKTDGR